MKDYYGILGVDRTASQVIIRDRYRRLAKQYHPDVNKAPDAEQIFKEVNEAYEVLGDPERRAQYDQPTFVFEQPIQQPSTPPHRDPAYRRPRPRPQRGESQAERLQQLKEEYRPLFFRTCLVGLLLSTLLTLDATLPARNLEEQVTEVSYVAGSRRSPGFYRISTSSERVFTAYSGFGIEWETASNVQLKISRIFNTTLEVKASSENEFVYIARIYSELFFFPAILIAASVFGLLFKRNTEILLNCAVVVAFVGVVCFYVLLL